MVLMDQRSQRGSALIGLGHYQPENIVTNDDLARKVDTNDEWIRTRTGIRERRIASESETVVDMGTAAARMALEDARIDDVSLVVVASTTLMDRSPNTAARVSAELGFAGPAVLDVNTACSGFEYALAIADQAISAGTAEHALVIGAEKLSGVTDWTDRRTCVLTADGAGAVVLGPSPEPTISPVVWGSVPGMLEAVVIDKETQIFSQDGRSVMRWVLTEAADQAKRVLDRAGLNPADIDVFAFHQANLRLLEPLARALGVTDGQVLIRDIEESGNTSAASVPLGLSKAWHRGELPRGGRAFLFGFGGGFTFAGQVVTLPV